MCVPCDRRPIQGVFLLHTQHSQERRQIHCDWLNEWRKEWIHFQHMNIAGLWTVANCIVTEVPTLFVLLKSAVTSAWSFKHHTPMNISNAETDNDKSVTQIVHEIKEL